MMFDFKAYPQTIFLSAQHAGLGQAAGPQAIALMQEVVRAGGLDALPSESIWPELDEGLMTPQPSRFFETLRDVGALRLLLPELDRLWGVPQRPEHHPEVDTGVHVMMVLDMAAEMEAPSEVRFACLCHDLGKGTTPADILPRHHDHEMRSAALLHPICDRLGIPSRYRLLADLVAREHGSIHGSLNLSPPATLRLLERCGAFDDPERFRKALQACECDARGRLGLTGRHYPQRRRLEAALNVALDANGAAEAERFRALGHNESIVAGGVHAVRVAALQAAFDALPQALEGQDAAAASSGARAPQRRKTP